MALGYKEKALFAAIKLNVRLGRAWLISHADLTAVDKVERSFVSVAIALELEEIALQLIRAGAPVNDVDALGNRPLHLATEKKYISVMLALIAAGAEVDAKNSRGLTSLHTAAAFGNLAVAEILVVAGASVNAPSMQGTPKDIASTNENWAMQGYLLSAEDPSFRDPTGPLAHAAVLSPVSGKTAGQEFESWQLEMAKLYS